MQISESTKTRLWALMLSLALVAATLLVVRINSFEIGLAYLGLLVGILAVGLMTNLWGGLAASAVGVFAIVLINQYAGIYPRENRVLNIGSELIFFLLAGPLAGMLSGAIETVQRRADHWLGRAEELTLHDTTLATLKPDWARLRLEEEMLRAGQFGRSLSVALLQLEQNPGNASVKPATQRAERLGALQAVIRVVRSVTQPPVVVTYLGNDQVMVILPEHTHEQARQVMAGALAQAVKARYFPMGRGAQPLDDKSLGKPLGEWGCLHMGVASLDGEASAGALLAGAKAELESSEVNRV